MAVSFYQVMICMLAGIAVIILLTTKYRVHAFFALLAACLVTGLGVQMPLPDIITTMKEGFGNIMKSLGFIIVLGTTLGVLLEHTGSTKVMADYILKKTGEKYAALAMSITGFIVGLPVFCDSGYIVLSGLIRPLSKRTGIPIITLAISLATGLLSVHCLIPPHPGAAAAAATIGVDPGKLVAIGSMIAIPAAFVGYWWTLYSTRKIPAAIIEKIDTEKKTENMPSVMQAFLPVITPVVLIAMKSFFTIDTAITSKWTNFFLSWGDPVVALSIGVALAFIAKKDWDKHTMSKILQESVEKAGSILVIIGAGGAFGAILAATKPGVHFSETFNIGNAAIFFPFLLTVILKTAQGSSTVAIITASAIVQPLLPVLGIHTSTEKLLCVLAMGGGSMIISHANDAYFWVIIKFSGLEMKNVLKVYSIATLLMGLVTLLMVYILSFILS
ncbi:MAG TPA: GntP family permease [Puia sp.]|nr:GntP family permease [Puia sp.]